MKKKEMKIFAVMVALIMVLPSFAIIAKVDDSGATTYESATDSESATVTVGESVDVSLTAHFTEALGGGIPNVSIPEQQGVATAQGFEGKVTIWGSSQGTTSVQVWGVIEDVSYWSVITVTVTPEVTHSEATETTSGSVAVNQSLDIDLVSALADKTLSVDSTNYSVATVAASAGKVTVYGKTAGTATIQIWGTYDYVEYWSEVTITVTPEVTHSEATETTSGSVAVNQSLDIALVSALSDKTLNVDSVDKDIALVEASAGKVSVFGKAVGTTTI